MQQRDAEADYTTKLSPRSVDETLRRFLELLEARHLKRFAVIDQRAEARGVGLDLRETVVVLFGNPAAGTPLMDARPMAALDLPLKLAIWADGAQTKVSYLSARAFAERHHLTPEDARPIASVDALTDALLKTLEGEGG